MNTAPATEKIIFVDMDGTLLATDVLWESVLMLVRKNPLYLFAIPFWILKGKPYFKNEVARRVDIDPSAMPYREDVLEFLRSRKEEGRKLILATASDRSVAEKIAQYVGIFDGIIATDREKNLAGKNKLLAIREYCGENSFYYIGNANVDIPIWEASGTALVVEPSKGLLARTKKVAEIEHVFSSGNKFFPSLLKALRVHQWVKNFLIFVPLLMAHQFKVPEKFLEAILAFIAYSFCASSVYITNDLLDLASDRHHPRKRFRPFASGALPVQFGILLSPLLLVIAFVFAGALLSLNFTAMLLVYYILTTAYSFYLKKVPVMDVLVLAALYTMRIFSGAVAVNVPVSPWLLAFSMFIFLSLAFIKRYAELRILKDRNEVASKGRGYVVDDVEFLSSVGPASGYLAVLVIALYVNSREVVALYSHPELLWLLGPCVLYWITRVWMLAHRGQMVDDPIIFTFKDKVSYVLGVIAAGILFAAL